MHTGGSSGSQPSTVSAGSSEAPPTTVKEVNRFPVARLSTSGLGGFCAVLTTGRAYCWGQEVNSSTPQLVQINPVEQISIGWVTCVISRGEVWCWHNHGDRKPFKQEGVAGATAIETSVQTTCAIAVGDVYCLGANTAGTVGDGTHDPRDAPTKVNGPVGATALTLDTSTACAVASGDLWCWGDNTFGQLGDGTKAEPPDHMANRPVPAKVAGLGRVTAASTGGARTCAISDGDLFCWGRGMIELSLDSLTPTALPSFGKVTAVSVGQESVCVIRDDGAVVCGGGNRWGQLGTSKGFAIDEVVVLKGIAGATAIAANNRSTCAANGAGTYCWGGNDDGQLGDGTTTSHWERTLVRWPN
ncbi:RCC1 domain-containing protein [Mycobacteroides salmoniphilum]|nr:RCC1 domain-containing protein [Mycobacteroides salmoniphilum]